MANANVTQSPAFGDSSPEIVNAIVQTLKDLEPLINADQHQSLTRLSKSSSMTVRPWTHMAWIASQDGNFFYGLSQDVNSACLMAPSAKVLDEFAARMRMVAEVAEKSAQRIRLAGHLHGEAFHSCCVEGPSLDNAGGALHV